MRRPHAPVLPVSLGTSGPFTGRNKDKKEEQIYRKSPSGLTDRALSESCSLKIRNLRKRISDREDKNVQKPYVRKNGDRPDP